MRLWSKKNLLCTWDSIVRSLAFSLSFSSCSLAISCGYKRKLCEDVKKKQCTLQLGLHTTHFFTLLRSSDTPPSFSGASLILPPSWFVWNSQKKSTNSWRDSAFILNLLRLFFFFFLNMFFPNHSGFSECRWWKRRSNDVQKVCCKRVLGTSWEISQQS